MTDQDRTKQLLEYYHQERLTKQWGYYNKGTQEYESRDRLLRVVAGLLMLFSGFVASLRGVLQADDSIVGQATWGILLVVLPAASTALLTLRNIYNFERLHKLYRRTYNKIGDLVLERKAIAGASDQEAMLKDYIKRGEDALATENIEWLEGWTEVQPADAASITGRAETGR